MIHNRCEAHVKFLGPNCLHLKTTVVWGRCPQGLAVQASCPIVLGWGRCCGWNHGDECWILVTHHRPGRIACDLFKQYFPRVAACSDPHAAEMYVTWCKCYHGARVCLTWFFSELHEVWPWGIDVSLTCCIPLCVLTWRIGFFIVRYCPWYSVWLSLTH